MSPTIPVQCSDSAQAFFRRLAEEFRFTIKSALYSPEAFGNIRVLLDGNEFEIDYRRDRGDETVYVVVHGTDYLVEDIAMLLGKPWLGSENMLEQQNWLLKNIDCLRSCIRKMSPDEVLQVLTRSCRERRERLFPEGNR